MAIKQILKLLAIGFVLAFPFVSARDDDDDEGASEEQYDVDAKDADKLADQVVMQVSGPQLPDRPQLLQQIPPAINAAPAAAPQPPKGDVKALAHHAKEAAKVARHAAKVANKVAAHSIKVTGHAKHALRHALGALHDARVDSAGLDHHQKETLKKAEAHLREATKTADHGHLKDLQKEKMEHDLNKKGSKSEREQMRHEIDELRKELKEKNIDDKDIDKALDELEEDLKKSDGPINDESKAELERLRRLVDSLDAVPEHKDEHGNETESHDEHDHDEHDHDEKEEAPQPVETKGLDIDTQMPYGDLEPFGREDTAQELTEDSIKESDGMVDQLEKAEVAEEKRSVFRALTRLRGAAITSFDGIARSQTGNIDEYNKIHQWRNTHPLHHLADEESDVSKWAFPENADF